jgi:hypothetical protein
MGLCRKWKKRLDQEKKAHSDWREDAQAATNAFFANNGGTADTPDRRRQITYPLFWSTVKVLHGRIYSQPPKPDVRKRYADSSSSQPISPAAIGQGLPGGMGAAGQGAGSQPPNAGMGSANGGGPNQPNAAGGGAGSTQPMGTPSGGSSPVDDNRIAQVLERGISYTIDTTEFDADGHMAVNDLLVTALGQAKIELITETESRPVINPATGQPILLDKKSEQPLPIDPMSGQYVVPEGIESMPAMEDVIVHQELRLRHFAWSQFRWEPQQHWSQVSWVGFDHWMTEDEIEDQFGVSISSRGDSTDSDGGNQSPGDSKPDSDKYKSQYRVTEIWDRKTKTRLFVCEDYQDLLQDPEGDPLQLRDFFPCPKPMLLNVRGDDLLPQPDYTYCEVMFDYCNNLNNRIALLTKQIKDMGFYDAGFPELGQLVNQQDGNLIPIANLAARIAAIGTAGGTGYDALVAKQDNSGKVEVVQNMMMLGDVMKAKIWEIYGVADIQRGSTDPNETATAQNIKQEWANIRVGERIRIVALWFRDNFRIMAELLAQKVDRRILAEMTGIELTDAEYAVLQSEYGRSYVIDVESDSTVVQDEFAQKQQRLEFLNTVTGYIEKVMPAVTQNAIPADLAKELLLFAINTFKDGRQLEQSINNLPSSAQQLAALQQRITQAMQQNEQLTKQVQTQGKQLQQVNMQKEARENAKTAADNENKSADTMHTMVLAAKDAQEIHESALKPIEHQGAMGNVTPIQRQQP